MIVSIYVISNYSLNTIRISRVLTAGFYLLLFLGIKKSNDRLIVLFFITLIIADVFNVFYEDPICRKLTSIFKLFGYLLLINKMISKVRFMKSNLIIKIVFTGVIGLNILAFCYLITSVSNKTNDTLELILLLVYGITLIALCSVAVNYHFRYNTWRSMYFIFFSFALLFTDVLAFLGYFLDYNFLFYGTRFFYVLALSLITMFALFTKEEKDILIENDI